jgi:hypothetical protein
MPIRLAPKTSLLAAGKSQRFVAAESGISEHRFSEIVRGWTTPRDVERDAIAAALGKQP